MNCDRRASHDCLLRIYSDKYGAKRSQFEGEQRAKYSHVNQNAGAVYESGKCIKCGLCVQVTQQEGEPYGVTFVGSAFDLKAVNSLDETLRQGLEKVGRGSRRGLSDRSPGAQRKVSARAGAPCRRGPGIGG